VYHVELVSVCLDELKCIGLVELIPAVVRLRLDVHADDIEPGTLITFCAAAGFAEGIK